MNRTFVYFARPLAVFALLASLPVPARADEAPSPYVAPFGLRGVRASTSIRAETAYGLDAGTSSTVVQYLTASYAFAPDISAFVRGGWIDFLPRSGASGSAFTNVTVGAMGSVALPFDLRLAAFVGAGLPVGQGGGDTPDTGAAAAIAAGNLARSRLEGSTMFSPNDLAPFVSADLAWVHGKWTAQGEANLYEPIRVRGSAVDHDATKTSLTLGAHVAYTFFPLLSLSTELRDQTYLSTPVAVAAGKSSRSYVTVGGGPRLRLALSKGISFRPGLAFVQALDDASPTQKASSYHVFQLDLPLVF